MEKNMTGHKKLKKLKIQGDSLFIFMNIKASSGQWNTEYRNKNLWVKCHWKKGEDK